MKRIYLLFILLLAIGSKTFAQDLQLTNNLTNPDTFLYNAGGAKTAYIIQWKFKNVGTAIPNDTSYKLVLHSPLYGKLTLKLPPAGSGWPGGLPKDSSVYYMDTVGFTGAPSTNPFNWCDTVETTKAGVAQADANPTDNRTCKSVLFKQDPLTVGTVNGTEGVVSVYPNPASEKLNIKYNFTASSKATITVTDMTGKVVIRKDMGTVLGEKEFSVDVNNLVSGLYMVELSVNDKRFINKVTIQ